MALVRQKVVLTAADPTVFVLEFQKAIIAGARYVEGTYPWIRHHPMHVELYVEGPADKDDWLWKSTAHLNCYGIAAEQFVYETKEALDDLSWADFRKVCAAKKIKGRDRTKMTMQYLAATSEPATFETEVAVD